MGTAKKIIITAWTLVFGLSFFAGLWHPIKAADSPDSGFSVEVSPSPLIASIKPGEQKILDLKIHNKNIVPEKLKVELKKFKVANNQGQVSLTDELPTDVSAWVSFSSPIFDVAPGEWYTQKVIVNTPKDAGFTYYFAIVVSRANPAVAVKGARVIEGSVAVLTLFGVDRQGATRKFDVLDFSVSKHLYEYLPTNFSLKLKNTGNTIVQPAGNIFIQRSSNSPQPIAVLQVNSGGSFLLPDQTRQLDSAWTEGFPVYVSQSTANNAKPSTHLNWDWSKAQHFRFGRYVARVVAVYNDGQRDIPVQTEVSFWVIPWKLILVVLAIIAVVVVGFSTVLRRAFLAARHGKRSNKKRLKDSDQDPTDELDQKD